MSKVSKDYPFQLVVYVAANFAYQVEQIHHQLRCKYFTNPYGAMASTEPTNDYWDESKGGNAACVVYQNELNISTKIPKWTLWKFVMNKVEYRQKCHKLFC